MTASQDQSRKTETQHLPTFTLFNFAPGPDIFGEFCFIASLFADAGMAENADFVANAALCETRGADLSIQVSYHQLAESWWPLTSTVVGLRWLYVYILKATYNLATISKFST